jgi:transcriptional regulator with XRE-family HTH domain
MATGKNLRILARNLLQRIEELDLTRAEVSRQSGVSVRFLSAVARESANPSVLTLEDLADALGTTVAALLVETEPLPPGFERLSVVLSTEHAATVKRWAGEAERELSKRRT